MFGGAEEQDDAPLTWADVAKRAGVSKSTVKRAVKSGELLPPEKVGNGRAVRFQLGRVRAYIKATKCV